MKQPDLYYFEAIKNDVTNLEYLPAARNLNTKFD